MRSYDYPDSMDESFELELVKGAEEHVYWISPRLTEAEMDALSVIQSKLGKEQVFIFEYKNCKLKDGGHFFSLEGETSLIDIQLVTDGGGHTFDSLLVVDYAAYNYNYEDPERFENARFIEGINEVKLKKLRKCIKSRQAVQLSFFDLNSQTEVYNSDEITEEMDSMDTAQGELNIDSKITKSDIILKALQNRICRVDLHSSGTKTEVSHIDISNILNLVGRPSDETADRLMLRWKIFGEDEDIKRAYRQLQADLENIKDTYFVTTDLNEKFILERDKPLFEREINKFRTRLKLKTASIIRHKLEESKSILTAFVSKVYNFTRLNKNELKTCSSMELESIMENLRYSFPSVEELLEKCDIVIEYSSLERKDILDKELSKRILTAAGKLDKDLAVLLKEIINP